jgi:uncharacterized protein YkwD
MLSRTVPPFLLAVLVAVVLALGPALLPAPAEAAPRLSHTERRLARIVNHIRLQRGLPALAFSRALSRAADAHSADLARRHLLDHASGDGTPFDRRVRRFLPASRVGETLAMVSRGGGGARAVVRMWLASPPHRAIMLSSSFRRIGIGVRTAWTGAAPALFVTADFASAR